VRFTWDADAGRYRTADGKLVKESAVRSGLDTVIAAQAATMRDASSQLVDGRLSLASWTVLMLARIKEIHLVALAAAAGGWQNLEQSDFGWVGQRLRSQYRYLVRFSIEISSGRQKLDGTVMSRAAMYAAAARDTHREAQRRLARARMLAGEEKSNLGVADHCKLCIQEARKGWQPFGTLLAIGKRTCLANCRCWFTFRAAA